MTQEEKAKAYDEALEIARQIHNGNPSSGTAIVVCEQIFPKLRESEDEEIRKDIIGGLMWQRDNLKSEGPHDNNLILPGFCLNVGKHLKYLEKQKEPENTSASTMAPSCWEVEQKEQKQTDLPAGFYVTMPDGEKYYAKEMRCNGMNVKVVEPKPAEWSEDEDFEDCLTELACELYEQRDESPENTAFKESKILKKWTPVLLKKAQRKAEWDEEDGAKLGALINYFEGDALDYSTDDIVNWLKRIRPSWKPSDHQMNILKAVKEYVGRGSGYWGEGLGSLIEDLEKLM